MKARVLEWVAISFSKESSQPRDRNQVSHIVDRRLRSELLRGKLGLILMGGAILSKSLIQFSVDGQGCVPSQLLGLRPPPETAGHSQTSLTQSLVGTLVLSPGSWCVQGFVCALQESVSPILWKFCYQIPLTSKVIFARGSNHFAGSPGWEICCGS